MSIFFFHTYFLMLSTDCIQSCWDVFYSYFLLSQIVMDPPAFTLQGRFHRETAHIILASLVVRSL